jgi:hypothetical protein
MLARLAAGTKLCPRCRLWLAVDAFGVVRSRPDGRAGWCRPCAAARQRERLAREAEQAQLAREAARAERRRKLADLAREAQLANLAREAQLARERLRRKADLAREADRTRQRREAALAKARFVLRCCDGALVDGPETGWWVALHRPGCESRWQPAYPADRVA